MLVEDMGTEFFDNLVAEQEDCDFDGLEAWAHKHEWFDNDSSFFSIPGGSNQQIDGMFDPCLDGRQTVQPE